MSKVPFPNGFESWAETHHEIVAAITVCINTESSLPWQVVQEQGKGGLYTLGIELAHEFEREFEGRAWDGEFFDVIEEWIFKKFDPK